MQLNKSKLNIVFLCVLCDLCGQVFNIRAHWCSFVVPSSSPCRGEVQRSRVWQKVVKKSVSTREIRGYPGNTCTKIKKMKSKPNFKIPKSHQISVFYTINQENRRFSEALAKENKPNPNPKQTQYEPNQSQFLELISWKNERKAPKVMTTVFRTFFCMNGNRGGSFSFHSTADGNPLRGRIYRLCRSWWLLYNLFSSGYGSIWLRSLFPLCC